MCGGYGREYHQHGGRQHADWLERGHHFSELHHSNLLTGRRLISHPRPAAPGDAFEECDPWFSFTWIGKSFVQGVKDAGVCLTPGILPPLLRTPRSVLPTGT